MIRALMLAMALMLCGCHSQKHVSVVEDAMATEVKEAAATVSAEESFSFSRIVSSVCDSLAFRLSADSIRTTAGVIYRPVMQLSLSAPAVISRENASAEKNDSTVFEEKEARTGAKSFRGTEDKETTAVASPVNTSLWAWLPAAVGLISIIVYAYFRHKRKNKTYS